MYLKTYIDIFSHIFKMVTPKAPRKLLLFIALNYLTSAAFIANLCSHLVELLAYYRNIWVRMRDHLF